MPQQRCQDADSGHRELLQVSLPHQGTRLRSAPPGALFGSGCARAPAFGPLGAAAADARPLCRPVGMRREPSPRLQDDASGGGAQTPGWTGRRSRVPAGAGRVSWELPSRPPSTQAEPISRGPGRQSRSYSGALHLDALNHARSTVCGSKADGMGAGVSGGLRSGISAGSMTGIFLHFQFQCPIYLLLGAGGEGGVTVRRPLRMRRLSSCSSISLTNRAKRSPSFILFPLCPKSRRIADRSSSKLKIVSSGAMTCASLLNLDHASRTSSEAHVIRSGVISLRNWASSSEFEDSGFITVLIRPLTSLV